MQSAPCDHPVVYQGLCASCGADVVVQAARREQERERARSHSDGSVNLTAAGDRRRRPGDDDDDEPRSAAAASSASSAPSHAIVLGGAHRTIHLSGSALRSAARRNSLALLSSRRLLCVLDLDHTLLHATSDARVAPFVGREEDLFCIQLPAHGPPPPSPASSSASRPHAAAIPMKTHFVKLRPGLASFLASAAALMDMHVYTMGARPYADAVVPLLDPTHTLIKHRVVSRDETGGEGSGGGSAMAVAKSLKRMHPCDEGLICIVDDRTDVWREQARNVVRAFEYLYFSGRGGEMNARPNSSTGQRRESAVREPGSNAGLNGVIETLPPIRSKAPDALLPPPAPAVQPSYAAAPVASPVPSPSPSAPRDSPTPSTPGSVASSEPSTPASTSSTSSSGKLRRRKGTSSTPVPAPEMQMRPSMHAPWTASGRSTPASSASATASSPIVIDGDDEPQGRSAAASSAASRDIIDLVPSPTPAPASATAASSVSGRFAAAAAAHAASVAAAPSAATAASAHSRDDGPTGMDIDSGSGHAPASSAPSAAAAVDDALFLDRDAEDQRVLDAAIDLTLEQEASAPRPRAPAPDPYAGDSATLPIFPFQFVRHPCPDNVLVSLTAVLQAIHTLFYEQVDRSMWEQKSEAEAKQQEASSSAHTTVASMLSPQDALSELLPLAPAHSIPRLLTLLKRTTLAGCVLVFSGVFPTVKHAPGSSGGPSGAQKAEAWIQATAYGATCLEEFPEVEAAAQAKALQARSKGEHNDEDEEEVPLPALGMPRAERMALAAKSAAKKSNATPPLRVTHVVAARDGSAKIHHAHALPPSQRPHIVHVSWLWHSLAHFQKGDESKFPLWSEGAHHRHEAGKASAVTKAEPATSTAAPPQSEPAGSPQLAAAKPADAPSAEAATEPPRNGISAAADTAASNGVAAAQTVPSAASDVTATGSASAAALPPVGSAKRRIPKKQPASTAPATAAGSDAAAAVPAAPASTAAPPSAASAAPSGSAAASTASAAATPAAPVPGTIGLHLVHHCASPPTASALVARVRAFLAAEADESNRRRADGELTRAQEMVKAAQLRSCFRRRHDGAAAAAPLSISSADARSTSRRTKSVSFSRDEIAGPSNPRFYRADEPHTSHDARVFVSTFPTGLPASAVKRKRMEEEEQKQGASMGQAGEPVPLDDVAQAKKAREEAAAAATAKSHAAGGKHPSSSALPPSSSSSSLSLPHSSFPDSSMMSDSWSPSSSEMYDTDGAGEEDPFAELGEEIFGDDEQPDGGDYEDAGRFDDDM